LGGALLRRIIAAAIQSVRSARHDLLPLRRRHIVASASGSASGSPLWL
jgi:hypothetical protein